MTLVHFTYSDTYDFSQNFYDKFTSSTSRVTSARDCELKAFSNKSSLFILSDYNETNKDASCLYSDSTYSDASYNDWISGLGKCDNTASNCYESSGNDIFGKGNNLSLYLSPLLTIMDVPSTIPSVNIEYFNTLYQNANDNLQTFITYRRQYLENYYKYIQADGTFRSDQQSTIDGIESNMNRYQTILQNDLFLINNQFNSLLENVEALNRLIKIRFVLLEIINEKIFIAEQFFNVLMNKNQGAIGELDINGYNIALLIFKNLIITIVILISIYLYFKKSE